MTEDEQYKIDQETVACLNEKYGSPNSEVSDEDRRAYWDAKKRIWAVQRRRDKCLDLQWHIGDVLLLDGPGLDASVSEMTDRIHSIIKYEMGNDLGQVLINRIGLFPYSGDHDSVEVRDWFIDQVKLRWEK